MPTRSAQTARSRSQHRRLVVCKPERQVPKFRAAPHAQPSRDWEQPPAGLRPHPQPAANYEIVAQAFSFDFR